MYVLAELSNRLRAAVVSLWPELDDCSAFDLSSISTDVSYAIGRGDLSTNAAMVLSKPLSLPPARIAEDLVEVMRKDENFSSVDVAGPGFVNIKLSEACRAKVIMQILATGHCYGQCEQNSVPVNLESVSANPTGPLHLGHCRVAIFADALANLLSFAGYNVTHEYYVNDTGRQIDILVESAYFRYLEALGDSVGVIPPHFYSGDYLKPVGQSLAAQFGAKLKTMKISERSSLLSEMVVASMLHLIRNDLEDLGVKYDVFSSETELCSGEEGDKILAVIEQLMVNGAVYKGRLAPPKGQKCDDWEDREQLLFRSTNYGDDIDRPLVKADGSYTYFASDIAYHYCKYLRGFRQQIDVFGADHIGYVARLRAAVDAVSCGEAVLDVRICQLVRLLRDGKPVRMSKRAGELITCRNLLDEVGRDALRFMLLLRRNDAHMDFDLHEVTVQSKDNPVFYVQYAYARSVSVLRRVQEMDCCSHVKELASKLFAIDQIHSPQEVCSSQGEIDVDFTRLRDVGEVGLIKRLMEWPRVAHSAARSHEPHRVAVYLYNLASDFHAHWSRGWSKKELRFIDSEDTAVTLARLGLVYAVALVLSIGLQILGVSAPEEMH